MTEPTPEPQKAAAASAPVSIVFPTPAHPPRIAAKPAAQRRAPHRKKAPKPIGKRHARHKLTAAPERKKT